MRHYGASAIGRSWAVTRLPATRTARGTRSSFGCAQDRLLRANGSSLSAEVDSTTRIMATVPPRLMKRACEGTAQRAASRSSLEGGLPDDRAGAGFTGGQLVGMRELTSIGDALYYLHAVIWTARRQQPKAAATSPSGVQKLP